MQAENTSAPSAKQAMIPSPTVGRVVHYHHVNPTATMVGATDRPALAHVTNVYDSQGLLAELYVIPCSWDGAPRYETSVPHQSIAGPMQSYWTWPPRS